MNTQKILDNWFESSDKLTRNEWETIKKIIKTIEGSRQELRLHLAKAGIRTGTKPEIIQVTNAPEKKKRPRTIRKPNAKRPKALMKWSQQDKDILAKLEREGKSRKSIAKILGRTTESITQMAFSLRKSGKRIPKRNNKK